MFGLLFFVFIYIFARYGHPLALLLYFRQPGGGPYYAMILPPGAPLVRAYHGGLPCILAVVRRWNLIDPTQLD
jgi:hypothetical protein